MQKYFSCIVGIVQELNDPVKCLFFLTFFKEINELYDLGLSDDRRYP